MCVCVLPAHEVQNVCTVYGASFVQSLRRRYTVGTSRVFMAIKILTVPVACIFLQNIITVINKVKMDETCGITANKEMANT